MKRTIKAVALAALLPLALSGCGDDSSSNDDTGKSFAEKPASEIRDAALKDIEDITSMTVVVRTEFGEHALESEISTDTEGRCVGTIQMGGGETRFVITGGDYYYTADEAFYKANTEADDELAAAYDGKWFKTPSAGQAQYAEQCAPAEITENFSADDEFSVGDVREIDGQDAIELISADQSVTAWIAVEGRHHLLRLVLKPDVGDGGFGYTDQGSGAQSTAPFEGDEREGVVVTFTDYGKKVVAEVPSGDILTDGDTGA
ncbi:hypothetical protein [Nocardioides sp. Root151]|uniref:hypothetical protein n=1 Tax=Nocardioides sp. Root151 TaxID=1736475 RepID=UPI00070259F2|nr:hypothetical protein [Nocardioides sp. Root151]KQZ68714.1 hypothetical protein ASD66_15680 [Nocardioides sp. Root151]